MNTALDFHSMSDALAHLARVSGDKVAFRYLADGRQETEQYTYAQLDAASQRVAAWLIQQGASSSPVLLAFPAGLEFVAALFGCFSAGAIAVPATLDGTNAPTRERLTGIVRDVKPRYVLTTERAASKRAVVDAALPDEGVSWCSTDRLGGEPLCVTSTAHASDSGVAMIQYTSGSTSRPRGVVVRHEQLAANQRMIARAFGMNAEAVVVSWLPHHHDMGLVGSILQTVFSGASAVLMPPSAFLREPLRWLHAIEHYRGSVSGAPDFGFDYCRRRVSERDIESLDLSSWKVAFNGAERVKEATLAEFADSMRPARFDPNAFVPCYGLAEATLFVAAADLSAPPATSIRSGSTLPLVCCGVPAHGSEIEIVDPTTLDPLPPGKTGEIWVRGPHVAQGYYNRPEETEQTFRGHTTTGEGPYLRTGDLGFFGARGLVVTGRMKDMMIVCGRNIHSEDVEAAVHTVMPGAPCAAVAVSSEHGEKLVLLQETRQDLTPEAGSKWIGALRSTVGSVCGVWLDQVVLLAPGQIPRTSSGKVRRSTCRELLATSALQPRLVLGESRASLAGPIAPPSWHAALNEREDAIQTWLSQWLAALGVTDLDSGRDMARLGLDSLKLLELSNAIERAFDVNIPWTALWNRSCHELSRSIAGKWKKASRSAAKALVSAIGDGQALPLAPAQSSIWVMNRLWERLSAYNLAFACGVKPELDAERVRQVLSLLAQRHPSLRSTFTTLRGTPVQRTHAELLPSLKVVAAEDWSEQRVEQTLLGMADDAFDLERGPLLRFVILRRGQKPNILLVVTHHLIADLWSVGMVLNEFAKLYAKSEFSGSQRIEPGSGFELERLDAPRPAHEDWWRRELAAVPLLRLPLAYPRAGVRSPLGVGRRFELGSEIRHQLFAFARQHGVSACSVVLAAFQHVLGRLSGQSRFAVGCAYAARDGLALAEAAVARADVMLIPTNVSEQRSLASAATRAHTALIAGAEHQPMPLQRAASFLAERDARLGPTQAVLVWQQLPSFASPSLLPVLIGAPNRNAHLGGLELRSIPLPIRYSLFDLVLTLADTGEDIVGDVRQSIDIHSEVSDAVIQRVSRVLESLQFRLPEVMYDVL